MESANVTTASRQEEIQEALDAFGGFNRKARASANAFLRSLRPEDVEAVLAVIASEGRDNSRIRRALNAGLIQYVALVGFFMLMTRLGLLSGSYVSAAFTPIGAVLVAALFAYFAPSPGQKRATRTLTGFRDRRIAGPMAAALWYRDKSSAKLVRDALVRELPTLRSSDAALLNTEQRAALNKELLRAATRRPQLALAILAAWEQVGDARCVPAVQKLANAMRRDKVPPAVVARAKECLPLLTESAQVHRTHHELLRAAGTTPDGEATLLRAGTAAAGAEADLLRPGDARGRGDEESAEAALLNRHAKS